MSLWTARLGQIRSILLVSWFKLCKVRSVQFGKKGIPYLNTYDGRTIRYPDPFIKANDTIKLDLETNKIVDFIKFDIGNVVMVTGGRNRGRVGVIKNREKHQGSFETIHVQDSVGLEFATRLAMCSLLERVQSRACLFLRAKVLSCPSLRRQERGLLINHQPLRSYIQRLFQTFTFLLDLNAVVFLMSMLEKLHSAFI